MSYKREELDYMTAQMLPVILEKLGVEAQGVSEVEVVSDLTGVLTLPAYKKVGGVEKIVEAPVSLLQDIALDTVREATDKANEATGQTRKATLDAINATSDLTKVKTEVLNAGKLATDAAGSVEDVKDKAKAATADCQVATAAARDIKEQTLTVKTETEKVISDGRTVLSEVRTVINETKTVKQGAETATLNANKASGVANTAADTANKETLTLIAIKKEAQDAAARANTSSAGAEAEIVKMKELQQSISGAASLSPTRMELTFLKEIATCNPYPQKIGFKLLPSFSLQNVLFLPAGGESVSVDPGGSLTINKAGTTRFYVIPTGATHLYQTISIAVRSPKIRKTSGGKMRLSGGKMRIY